MFTIVYEIDGNVLHVGHIKEIGDIMVSGNTMEELVANAALQLYEYSQDYIADYELYSEAPNRKEHLQYIKAILKAHSKDGTLGIKKLIAKTEKTKLHKFKDFAPEEDKRIFDEAKNWDISDDELFENSEVATKRLSEAVKRLPVIKMSKEDFEKWLEEDE